MWERLAYYNLRVMAPIYIMQADNAGGLHLTAVDKGTIYAWWAVLQSLLPIVTGGLADRFGYKSTLTFAISTMMVGYLMIALLRDVSYLNNYWGFFSGILVLATGTAFFKPGLQGSIAHTLTKENSSVGWGIFYWVVNVGAFIGHFLPSVFLLKGLLGAGINSPEAWRNLFLASAVFTSFNLLLLFGFKDIPSGASRSESLAAVVWRTVINIFEPRLLAWIVIMSCFWLMMFQLWDLQPNFIADWVDSRPLADALSHLPAKVSELVIEQTSRGPLVPQQVLLSFNSFFIIVGVVAVGWLTRRMLTLTAMLFGMISATAGVLIAGLTPNAGILVLGIVFFSLGEMATGPKNNQYLALIAPSDKKGVYLGYVNIPAGVGIFAGAQLAGFVYGHYGEKAVLALRYLAEKTSVGMGKNWNGNVSSLEDVLGVKRTEAMAKLQEVTGQDAVAVTKMLWETYHPHLHVWIPFAAIGVLAAIALWIFGRMARKWSDMNA